MSTDPYAAPKSHVADVAAADSQFIPEGQGVSAGNGWSWIAAAWSLVRQNTGAWIVLFILFVVVVLVLGMIPIVGPIALYVVMPILMGGIMIGCEAARGGSDMTIGHLFAGFSNNAGRLAGLGIFTLVAFLLVLLVIAGIFGFSMAGIFIGAGPDFANDPAAVAALGVTMILAGLVMLAISVPIYMALWFSYPLVALNDMAVGQALKTSFFACLKNIVPFLVYGIAMFVLMIVASIPLGLGWLLLGPVLLASFYTGYRDVFHRA